MGWAAEVAGYSVLVAASTWLSRHHAIVIVGLALCLCAMITNVAYFGSTFATQVFLEFAMAVGVIRCAAITFQARPNWPATIIACVCVVDIAFCAALALIQPRTHWYFGWVTNGFFAVNCLCVACPGAADVLRRIRVVGAGGHLGNADRAVDARRAEGASR